MQHAKELIACAKCRYRNEGVKLLMLFNWPSGRAAMAEDALVATEMGWKRGGKQPHAHLAIIRDAHPRASDPSLRQIGAAQRFVFREGEKPFHKPASAEDFQGIAKGMKQMLWERGLWAKEMRLKRSCG